MDDYPHHVSGFFAHRVDAENARSELTRLGVLPERIQILDSRSGAEPPSSDSNEVLKDVVVDGAVGAAVGTGVGALTELALVAGSVSLFVASPLVAPLMLLGWGATLGGFLGAAIGAGNKDGRFSALIRDAIASGQVVLTAETLSEAQTLAARDVIKAAVGGYSDLPAT